MQTNILRGCSGGNQIVDLAKMINLSNGHVSKSLHFSKITIQGISNTEPFCSQILYEDGLSENKFMNWPTLLNYLMSIHLMLEVFFKNHHS